MPEDEVIGAAPVRAFVRLDGSSRDYSIRADGVLRLGRSDHADVHIGSMFVARTHATIYGGPDGFWIESTEANGTMLNDEFITAPARLKHADRLTFVDVSATFYLAPADPDTDAAPTAAPRDGER